MYKLADENIAMTGTVCSQIKETDYKYSVNIKLENKLKLTVYIDKKKMFQNQNTAIKYLLQERIRSQQGKEIIKAMII